jgi:FHA domain
LATGNTGLATTADLRRLSRRLRTLPEVGAVSSNPQTPDHHRTADLRCRRPGRRATGRRLHHLSTAKTTARRAMSTAHTAFTRTSVVARLRDTDGRHYPLQAPATRIGRLPDNDIVLDDDDVSRHHALIIDTGGSFVITDVRSANGVRVQHHQLRPSATLADGDLIDICGHRFTVEIQQQ